MTACRTQATGKRPGNKEIRDGKNSHREREIRGRTKQEWTSQGKEEIKNEQEIRCQIYTKHWGTKPRQPDIAGKVG